MRDLFSPTRKLKRLFVHSFVRLSFRLCVRPSVRTFIRLFVRSFDRSRVRPFVCSFALRNVSTIFFWNRPVLVPHYSTWAPESWFWLKMTNLLETMASWALKFPARKIMDFKGYDQDVLRRNSFFCFGITTISWSRDSTRIFWAPTIDGHPISCPDWKWRIRSKSWHHGP